MRVSGESKYTTLCKSFEYAILLHALNILKDLLKSEQMYEWCGLLAESHVNCERYKMFAKRIKAYEYLCYFVIIMRGNLERRGYNFVVLLEMAFIGLVTGMSKV